MLTPPRREVTEPTATASATTVSNSQCHGDIAVKTNDSEIDQISHSNKRTRDVSSAARANVEALFKRRQRLLNVTFFPRDCREARVLPI
ncbi:MAG: hypothetical protein HC794_01490 [Nitrospiraceae bacterium]|nr:hypothetical protein [Nitrospiraceae bacterium]